MGREGSTAVPKPLVCIFLIWGTPEEYSMHICIYYTHNRHMSYVCIRQREKEWKKILQNDKVTLLQ